MSRRHRLPLLAGALLAQGCLAAPALAGVAYSDPVEHAVGLSTFIQEITTAATGSERTTIVLLNSTSAEFGSPAELVLFHLDAAGAPAGSQRVVLPESRAVAQQADVDGDGAVEVVVLRPEAEMITVYRRVGDGLEKGPDSPVGPNPQAMAVGDVDGDGDPDAVVQNQSVEYVLMKGDGTGAFGPPQSLLTSIDIEAGSLLGPGLEDVDADGDLDLLVTGVYGLLSTQFTSTVVRVNDGTGTFAPPGPGFVDRRGGGVDVTGDGIPDSVTGGRKTIPGSFGKPPSDPYAAAVSIGDGNGGFVPGPRLGDVNTAFVKVVQLDGRGPWEIVVRDLFGPSPGSLFYFPSLGDGTFGPQIPLQLQSYSVDFLDLNGDGGIDLLDQESGKLIFRFALPIAAGSLDFGEVPVATAAERPLTVTNDGAAPLPLGAAMLGGPAAGDFTLLENSCVDKTLTAGQSCTMTLRFRPGDAGARTAEVTFTGGPEPRRFAITGVGRPAAPAAGAARCRVVQATPEPARDDGGQVALTAAQLRTNQRIGQAAIRRLNAVEAWLAAGIQARDVCGGAFGAGKLASGIASAGALSDLAEPSLPDPRPVVVAKGGDEGGSVRLSAAQLRINQRIYQAAIRRADALEERLDGKLTGSDLAASALTQDKLHPRLRILSATPAEFEPPRSRTEVAAGRGGGGEVALTAGQLRINQRIAQAAVRRANALVARLEAGLTGDAFAEGSITARNLASGVVKP